jgi:hypothetical protein
LHLSDLYEDIVEKIQAKVNYFDHTAVIPAWSVIAKDRNRTLPLSALRQRISLKGKYMGAVPIFYFVLPSAKS